MSPKPLPAGLHPDPKGQGVQVDRHDRQIALNEVIARYQASDMRQTPIRRRMSELMFALESPCTVAELRAKATAASTPLSMSALYRLLAVLEKTDIVRRWATGAEMARFSLALNQAFLCFRSESGPSVRGITDAIPEDRVRRVAEQMSLDVIRVEIVVADARDERPKRRRRIGGGQRYQSMSQRRRLRLVGNP